MPRTAANGIEIEYDTVGDAKDPALLLVMGFTAQLIAWEEGFCRALADRGFHVIRFDNRDCGLSTKFDGVAVDVAALMAARGTARCGCPTLSEHERRRARLAECARHRQEPTSWRRVRWAG
jgi:pimeloyl-ACP methyl ester carboxylesterase